MLDKSLAIVNRVFEFLIFLLFLSVVIIGGMQVFNRFILNQSLSWSEEFMVYANIWMIFLAIPVAYRRGSHIGMNLFVKNLPARGQLYLSLTIDAMWVVLAAAVVIYTTVVMGVASNQNSPALGLRMDRAYMGLLVGNAYLGILALRKIAGTLAHARGSEAAGGVPC